ETFNTMAANLEELFDARRQLVAWASHDLRTPVASIQAMLEAMRDGLASTEEDLPALRQQTRTLAMLVDDLFELARIDAGALKLELQGRAGAGARVRLRERPRGGGAGAAGASREPPGGRAARGALRARA